MPAPDLASYVAVAALGTLLGIAELVARYRDAPLNALASWSAAAYLLLNAAAAVAALQLIHAFDWSFGYEADSSGFQAVRILTAGLGAMALFRSALFVIPVNGSDVNIGPATLMQALLSACDRGVDRTRARRRAKFVRKALQDKDYASLSAALPALSLGLVQNPSNADQQQLSDTVRAVQGTNFDDQVKLYLIGLAIMSFGGGAVLQGSADLADSN